MGDRQISEMSSVTALTSTDLIPIVTGSGASLENKHITASNLAEPVVMTHEGVDNTGATDDSVLIQSIFVDKASLGIKKFYFPAGSYKAVDVYLVSDTEVYGDGDATVITSTDNVFLNNGLHPDGYIDYTYYTLNDITAGDITLTFDTGADASNFTVDGLAFVRSEAEDAVSDLRTPHFVEVVKIKAVGAGTVTLEYAIKDAVTSPEIALPLATNHVNLTPQTPDRFVENMTLRDMKLVSTGGGNGWRVRTAYKCTFKNILLDTDDIFVVNAVTHCVVENIRGDFKDRGIELKTGAYNTVIRGIDVRNANTTNTTPLIDLGEYCRDITVEDFSFLAPGRDHAGVAGILKVSGAGGKRLIIKNGRVVVGDVYSIVNIINGKGIDNEDITISDIQVQAKSIARPIYLANGTGTSGLRFTIRNIDTGNSTLANNVNADSVAGYWLNQTNQDLTIHGCRINGSIALDSTKTTPGMVFTNNRYTNFTGTDAVASQVLSEIYFKDNHRIGADSIYSTQLRKVLITAVTSTSANNIVHSWTIPASQTWLEGDLLRFEVYGNISGTNDAKEINIADNTGAMIAATWLAAETGGFIITGQISIFDNTKYRTAFVANTEAIGAYAQNTESRTSLDLSANGRTFTLQAWVDNASDTISIQSVKMWPDLLGT